MKDFSNGKHGFLTTIRVSALSASVMAWAGTCIGGPAFVTSDPNGGWSDDGYYVHNNMWNSARYTPCTSTLSAWSRGNWKVVTRMNNKTGDGAVKTYPNVHKDYHAVSIGSFDAITSRFAETSPRVGIYDFSYDIWINGIARPGCSEIMIWTDNFHQVPSGRHMEDVVFDGQTFQAYKTADNHYIAFVAATNVTSGKLNLLDIMKWTMAKHWIPGHSTLDQICFGVEVVSTDDSDATFRVTEFSITAKNAAPLPGHE